MSLLNALKKRRNVAKPLNPGRLKVRAGFCAWIARRVNPFGGALLCQSPAPESAARPLDSKSIMLIDDDPRFSAVLAKLFESRKWSTRTYAEVYPALCELSGSALIPDLIICDVRLPNIDGISFLRWLRMNRPTVPVLMLTSDDDCLLEAEAVLAGAEALVRKFDDPRVLLAWCGKFLNLKGAMP